MALTLPWAYIPSSQIWKEYRDLYVKYYSAEQVEIADVAFKNNRCLLNKEKQIKSEKYFEDFKSEYVFPLESISCGTNIVLYGAGCGGTDIKRWLAVTEYCNIVAWCDKNYQKFEADMQVESPDIIQDLQYDYILVAVENPEVFEEIKRELCDIYHCDEKRIVGPIDCQRSVLAL